MAETVRVQLSGEPIELAMSVTGEGPDLLFVHGLGSAQVLWQPHIAMLSGRYRCWNLDLRGHGASDRSPDQRYSLADYTLDVRAALDHIGRPTVGIGHSLGGVSLVRAAATGHDGIHALYILDSPVTRKPGEQSSSMALFERQLAMVRSFQAEDRAVSDYEAVLAEAMNPMGDTNRALMVAAQLTGRAESLSQVDPACIAALIDGLMGDTIAPKVTMPLRMIAADPSLGAAFPAEATATLRAASPQAQVETMRGVGHQLMMMQGFDDMIQTDLESWLSEVW